MIRMLPGSKAILFQLLTAGFRISRCFQKRQFELGELAIVNILLSIFWVSINFVKKAKQKKQLENFNVIFNRFLFKLENWVINQGAMTGSLAEVTDFCHKKARTSRAFLISNNYADFSAFAFTFAIFFTFSGLTLKFISLDELLEFDLE